MERLTERWILQWFAAAEDGRPANEGSLELKLNQLSDRLADYCQFSCTGELSLQFGVHEKGMQANNAVGPLC